MLIQPMIYLWFLPSLLFGRAHLYLRFLFACHLPSFSGDFLSSLLPLHSTIFSRTALHSWWFLFCRKSKLDAKQHRGTPPPAASSPMIVWSHKEPRWKILLSVITGGSRLLWHILMHEWARSVTAHSAVHITVTASKQACTLHTVTVKGDFFHFWSIIIYYGLQYN